jgi:predicted amidohydrolase
LATDNFPNSLALGHSLARMGAQIVLSPSAWAVAPDHDNHKEPYGALWQGAYQTLAELYDLNVVGVSNVGWLRGGPWQGYKCIGCSLAVGPGGEILAQGPYGETAEQLVIVPIKAVEPEAKGTDISEALARKGYNGI